MQEVETNEAVPDESLASNRVEHNNSNFPREISGSWNRKLDSHVRLQLQQPCREYQFSLRALNDYCNDRIGYRSTNFPSSEIAQTTQKQVQGEIWLAFRRLLDEILWPQAIQHVLHFEAFGVRCSHRLSRRESHLDSDFYRFIPNNDSDHICWLGYATSTAKHESIGTLQ